MVILVLFLSN